MASSVSLVVTKERNISHVLLKDSMNEETLINNTDSEYVDVLQFRKLTLDYVKSKLGP